MDGRKLIRTVQLENILSYGPSTPVLQLEPLNVIVGPNASGKSNFLEALAILAAAPRDLQEPLRVGGGVVEWLWKGSEESPKATIEVTVENLWNEPLRYRLSFSQFFARFVLKDEAIEDEHSRSPGTSPAFYYQYRDGNPVIRVDGEPSSERQLKREDVKFEQSILSQLRNPGFLSGLERLTHTFEGIRIYREFPLGHNSPLRRPQQADLIQDYLLEDGSNLAAVLSYLLNQPATKSRILDHIQDFHRPVQDILAALLGGSIQVSFHERGLYHPIPSIRLSDGTLRFLCLLAVLCHPNQPSVICIEEPETGLHPDVIPKLAKLLVEASERSQVIVTTHSDILVDALSDTPEAVVICEKVDGATQLRRLDADALKSWLEDYRLGELWTRGDLGGNVW
ncbi:MAG: AAA family ATPase [Chloroflexi bacterium]|nr:AAA family ATPase [Chloroflexota bacterium]